MEVELLTTKDEMLRQLMRCDLAARTCVTADPEIGGITIYEGKEFELKNLYHAMRSGHMSVLEHCNMTFLIKNVSRVVQQQLTRHRLASYSIQSLRYTKPEVFFVPTTIMYNQKDVYEVPLSDRYGKMMSNIKTAYEDLESIYDIPIEDCRYILPLASTGNLVMTVNLREFIHICQLRLCARTQEEFRVLASEMCKEVIKAVPWLEGWLYPQCEYLGYCPEKKSCGKKPSRKDVVSTVFDDADIPVVVYNEQLKQRWKD